MSNIFRGLITCRVTCPSLVSTKKLFIFQYRVWYFILFYCDLGHIEDSMNFVENIFKAFLFIKLSNFLGNRTVPLSRRYTTHQIKRWG